MKIVIGGAGEVGSHLAKLLSKEDQDIILIDNDAQKLAVLDANYNLMTMVGRPTSFETLRESGVAKCDLFIAVTPYETDNVTACAIAKALGAQKTVARIDNYEYMRSKNREFFEKIGVNDTIYPEYLAALEIRTALRHTWVRNWFELHDGQLIVVGVKLRHNASIVNMKLRDITFTHHNFHICAIKRHNHTIIPGGYDEVHEGDIIYVMTTRQHLDELREMCGKKQTRIRNIMIMGGGKIAARLSNLVQGEYNIKILERDADSCRRLPEHCPGCEIICADARDNEILLEEGIEDMDAFIALTESSETNILACLTAKEFGVGKTIAEVENIQFISEAEGLNIGTIINKKLLASSKIFQHLLDSDTQSNKCMSLAGAEVAEFDVRDGAKITRGLIKDLKLSKDMTIAGLIRDGRGMLVSGNTQIKVGDSVVVFALSGTLHRIEKLFT
ncbi:MAG: Trk system potassium transporter TrkA [Barnesiella sp.]|nr:Trk system potassium transporter TrkA [Bacteroidales bacterium]MBD5245282.1 Trk system potassium transporter TrkA [Barnesiella sp.]MBD5249042.1 Trk system potassium transporter TrkA [Barnesiella sp.]